MSSAIDNIFFSSEKKMAKDSEYIVKLTDEVSLYTNLSVGLHRDEVTSSSRLAPRLCQDYVAYR